MPIFAKGHSTQNGRMMKHLNTYKMKEMNESAHDYCTPECVQVRLNVTNLVCTSYGYPGSAGADGIYETEDC